MDKIHGIYTLLILLGLILKYFWHANIRLSKSLDDCAQEKPQSMTFDNGKEFAQHQRIVALLNNEVFFAKPYHSWERVTNENTNGLIRQFLPKSMPLDKLCTVFIQAIEDNLNNRPRKILGYQPPLEVKSGFESIAFEFESALCKIGNMGYDFTQKQPKLAATFFQSLWRTS